MPWFEGAAGNRLWYEDNGVGTAIIFVHGWCMSSAVWDLQREALTDSFRVITLDLRGHGNSSPHPEGFHIKGCAEDIAALIGHLDLHHTILAGWSLGALIALVSVPLCKERLAGLMLISATPRFVQALDFPFGLSQLEVDGMAKKVQRNIQRALEGFVARMFAPGESKTAGVQNIVSTIPVPPTFVALQALEALADADLRDHLSVINIPTLIVHGDSDVICLPLAAEFMAKRILLSQQVLFSGCGHVPFLTQSNKFNACLEGFREQLSGGEYRQE